MGLKFDPNHLSMYQLIIEKNTKFFNLYSENEKIMPKKQPFTQHVFIHK